MNQNMAILKLGFTGLSALIYLINRAEYYGIMNIMVLEEISCYSLSVLQKQIGLTY